MEISIGYLDKKGSRFWENFEFPSFDEIINIPAALRMFDERMKRRQIFYQIFIILVNPEE